MKYFLLAFLLFVTQVGTAQDKKLILPPPEQTDTVIKIEPIEDPYMDSASMNRNMNNILALQKERRAKEKKGAIIRIAIGAGFLVLLVIGLMRRRRIKNIE